MDSIQKDPIHKDMWAYLSNHSTCNSWHTFLFIRVGVSYPAPCGNNRRYKCLHIPMWCSKAAS